MLKISNFFLQPSGRKCGLFGPMRALYRFLGLCGHAPSRLSPIKISNLEYETLMTIAIIPDSAQVFLPKGLETSPAPQNATATTNR